VKPETEAYLDDANQDLDKARRILAINICDQAARLAYHAQFHAAQALIFVRTGGAAKTHKGVRRLFHKLAKAEPGLDQGLARGLTNAYRYKELADYETGMSSTVTVAEAGDAIAAAEYFVAEVTRVLISPTAPGP
jgi:uncharacterized protein (UPF0332 family)